MCVLVWPSIVLAASAPYSSATATISTNKILVAIMSVADKNQAEVANPKHPKLERAISCQKSTKKISGPVIFNTKHTIFIEFPASPTCFQTFEIGHCIDLLKSGPPYWPSDREYFEAGLLRHIYNTHLIFPWPRKTCYWLRKYLPDLENLVPDLENYNPDPGKINPDPEFRNPEAEIFFPEAGKYFPDVALSWGS